jgi:anti-sigma regulatory factor (Ser/Thr protein kinase)
MAGFGYNANAMRDLEGNLDDTRASLVQVIGRLEPTWNNAPYGLVIDLRKYQYLGPFVATYLASVIRHAKHMGQEVVVHLPSVPLSLKAFCAFSGLMHLVGSGPAPEPGHPQSETVPLTVTKSNWLADRPIMELIHRHLGTPSEDFENSLGLCVRELFQNIEDHAHSPIGGWYCARCLTGRKEIRVAVVDRGLGIHATLAQRYPEITDSKTALRSVVAGNFTARTLDRNLGFGISNLAEQVSRLNGRVVIVTGDAWAELSPAGRWKYERMPVGLTGTAFFFSLPVHVIDGKQRQPTSNERD